MELLKEVSISSIASSIAFRAISKPRTKLDLSNQGRVNAQQLQTMRILDESSAGLLERVWSRVSLP